MDSIDILHTVDSVAISTSSLRFCYTLDVLTQACQSIRADLESIRFSISHPLYALLDNELRDVHWKQLLKIKGYQA